MKLLKSSGEKIGNNLKRYQVEICVFVYLAYLLLVTAAEEINGWVSVWYAADYSIGFSSRLLLGSFLKLFCPDFLPTTVAYRFVIGCLLLIALLLAIVLGKCYRAVQNEMSKTGLLIFVALYLASPASPAYLWTKENMGRLETFLFLITMIMIVLYMSLKSTVVKCICFTVLGILCISLHQAYVFLFFPILVVMLIQDIYENNWSKKQVVTSIITVVVIGATFLFFQFASKIYYQDVDTMVSLIQKRTDLYVCDGTLEQEYFWEIKQHFVNNMLPDLRQRLRFGVLTILALSPIILFYLKLWKDTFKHAMSKLQKSKYWLIWATNLMYIPIFALMTDWERWWGAFFTVQFLTIVVLAYKKDENMLFALQKIAEFAKKNWILIFGIILYLVTLDKFQGINNMDQVETMYYKLYDLRMFIKNIFV